MIFYQTGRMIICCYSIICFLWIVPAIAENADFWIIEKPSALYIYNQYEQRLNANEKSEFNRFSAWQILSRDQLLSDQYTRVAKTQIEQSIYYLQLTEKGRLLNHQQAGQVELIKNARLLSDTIQIKSTGPTKLKSGPDSHALPEGTLLLRLFQVGKKLYVRELNGSLSGWLDRTADYKIFHVDKRAVAYEEKLFDQAGRIFQSYNRRLNQLFSYLNKWTDKSLTPPKWEKTGSSPFLTFTLYPTSYQGHFSATRKYLVQELNDLLHGTDYTLFLDQGSITIKKTAP